MYEMNLVTHSKQTCQSHWNTFHPTLGSAGTWARPDLSGRNPIRFQICFTVPPHTSSLCSPASPIPTAEFPTSRYHTPSTLRAFPQILKPGHLKTLTASVHPFFPQSTPKTTLSPHPDFPCVAFPPLVTVNLVLFL